MFIDTMPRPVRGSTPAKRTALIVEDDPRLQKSMSKHLARAGFHVLSALHYDAAVCHLATHKPHVVCIDVGLPSKSGYELCEYIRGPLGLKLLPIVVTSEHGHSEDMAFAEAAGGNAFLRKPFSNRQLTHCVASLLDRADSSLPPLRELAQFASNSIPDAGHVRAPAMGTRVAARPLALGGRFRMPMQADKLADSAGRLLVHEPTTDA